MRRTRRQPEKPRNEIPGDGSEKSRKYDFLIDCFDVDHPRAHRLRNADTEYESCNEVEKCSPDDGLAGR